MANIIKIHIPGPITITADLSPEVLKRTLESLSISQGQVDSSTVTDLQREETTFTQKRWADTSVALKDVLTLYKDVKPVGKRMLKLIAKHWEDGISFDDIKALMSDVDDLQRRMNTVLFVARRMGYLDRSGKGVAPWNTEYMVSKPMYTMRKDLADVILAVA